MISYRRTLLPLLRLSLLLVGSASLHGLSLHRTLPQFGLETWQSDSGLPQNTVHSVLQTRDGFLWIATEGGLVRFDGLAFRVYDTENTPQFRSNIVNDLKEDGSGTLWISTTAGLLRERGGLFKAFGMAEGLPSGAVSATFPMRQGGLLAITAAGLAVLRGDRFAQVPETEAMQGGEGRSDLVEDGHGQIWVAGSKGVILLGPDGSKLVRAPVSAALGELHAIAAPEPGEIWVGGRNGIEVLREGAADIVLPLGDRLPSSDVRALLPDGAGGVWIGTSRGLARWSAGTLTWVGGPEGLADASVDRLYRDRQGALWVATNRGIARVTPEGGRGTGVVELMARRSRLGGVLSILEDREGSMWFGTDNAGLTMLREQAFSTVTEQDGLTAGFVRAVFQDASGAIWIGTDGGGLDRIDRGSVSALVSRPALSSDVVLSIAQTGEDLWVGTPDGLNRIRNGQVRVFTTNDGLVDDFVRSLYADTDGSLWIGTRNGLSHLTGGRFTSYSRTDGLGSDLIGAILRGGEGDLWVGTLGGLSRMEGNGFRNFTTGDGLGSNAVTSLLDDGRGTMWIGTQDAGLTRLRAGRFAALEPEKDGLPETVFGLLEDSSGDLWLSSRRGIFRVSVSALDGALDRGTDVTAVRSYGIADGLRISEGSSGGHPAAWRMRDGTLWFATLDGAASVDPSLTTDNELPPPTAIEQVRLDDQAVDVGDLAPGARVLRMPPGERRLGVQYAGLSFVAPRKVRYRYKLEGFDKDWIDAGGRREAFYTNVPPGRYRFLVISSNNDGVWSTEPSGFRMRVEPTLLQTWWFYVGLAAALGALGFALYRWRVHSVEAQYQAVLAERGRIAREIHDTLAQGYVAVSVQLELTVRLLEVSKEAALKQLDATKELVRGSLADARSSIWNLRSQQDAGTLPSLLAAMTESRTSVNGPGLKLDIRGTYRAVSAHVEKEILRVAQEAVTNSVRHAGAKHIRVLLRYDASTVQLQVIDDGSGFTGATENLSREGHFGLQGMRERAARIGGRFRAESIPGKGTMIELEVDPRKAEREDLL